MSEIRLDILAHADFSGQLRQTKRCPGMAAFGAEIEAIRRENPDGTLLLDAGDEFSANFWGGLPMVEALNVWHTDAMTLGNHEFDRGDAILESCIAAAKYPVLCANIFRRDTGAPVPGTRPWVILERQGVRIGVLGLTTEYTPYMVTASAFAPYEARSCAQAAREAIPQMRLAGAQIIVALCHIPFYVEEDGTISGELADLLRDMPPVDVCIGGHIPGDYAGMWGDTAVLKGGFSGNSLCHAVLYWDTDRQRVVRRQARVVQTDRSRTPDPVCAAYAARVTGPFEALFSTPLATADELWEMHLACETKLGNFLAQCVEEAAGTQIAYMNATSSGGRILPGPVTAEDIMQVMGFNDPLLCAEITGAQLWRLLELVYEPARFGNNAALIYSGIVVHADHTRPAGEKIRSVTLRDGTPIEPERVYTVATSEYMASGGNDTGLVADSLQWHQVGTRMYDAIFAYLKRHGGKMYVSPEQRLYEIGTPENNNAPF